VVKRFEVLLFLFQPHSSFSSALKRIHLRGHFSFLDLSFQTFGIEMIQLASLSLHHNGEKMSLTTAMEMSHVFVQRLTDYGMIVNVPILPDFIFVKQDHDVATKSRDDLE
jgi:hypothetical protein